MVCSKNNTLNKFYCQKLVCNFYIKVIFWNIFWIFWIKTMRMFFFIAEFKLLMFHNNSFKISEKLNKKICPHRFLHNLHTFYYGKNENIGIFKNHCLEKNVSCIGSYDKWFCIKSWQVFANLLLLCKAPSKKTTFWKMSKHTVDVLRNKSRGGYLVWDSFVIKMNWYLLLQTFEENITQI